MENQPIATDLAAYRPREDEKEKASNAYLMSVIAIMAGMPLPVINLLATAIFFLANRKASLFIRWHCTQALLSQATVFIVNSIGFTWTMRVLFGNAVASDYYFAYLIALFTVNLTELVLTMSAAVKVRKGRHVSWWGWGPATHLLLGTTRDRKNAADKTLMQTLLSGLGFTALFYALSFLPWTDTLQVRQISRKQQENLAGLILKMERTEHQELTADSLTGPLYLIRDRICAANGIDTAGIRLHLFRNPVVNAFALPGGHIIINTGLLGDIDNPDALAGVIAHEMGHIRKDHVIRKLSREVGLSALLMLAGGGEHFGLIKQLLKTLTASSFDRDQEREADAMAVRYLHKSAIDPLPLAGFFDMLSDSGKDAPGYLEWVSTHPGASARAADIRKVRRDMDYRPALSGEDWNRLVRGTREPAPADAD